MEFLAILIRQNGGRLHYPLIISDGTTIGDGSRLQKLFQRAAGSPGVARQTGCFNGASGVDFGRHRKFQYQNPAGLLLLHWKIGREQRRDFSWKRRLEGAHVEKSDRTGAFVSLFAAHDRGIYKYIMTLLADPNSTQEVFQETSVTLWQKFDGFQPGGNFFAWACRVAYFEVLKFRQTARRDRLRFSDDLLETLAEERSASEEILQPRRAALPDCVDKLPPGDRELVDQRYGSEESILDIARRTGRSVNTLYKTLERIRRTLMKCIEEAVSRNEGHERQNWEGGRQ